MKRKYYLKWILMICLVAGMDSCNLNMPKEKNTSYETLTVKKQDITAQESLLSAQLNEASNMYNGAQAVIALYIALGGGTK